LVVLGVCGGVWQEDHPDATMGGSDVD